jgi:hypothetical protein
MADAFKVLSSKIAMFRVVADVPDEMMPDMAQIIDSEIKRTAGAGQDPDGTPWPPKKDGTPFKFYLPSDLTLGVIGRTVLVRITSRPVVLHNNGTARFAPQRKVIPQTSMPDAMLRKIKARLVQRFNSAVSDG